MPQISIVSGIYSNGIADYRQSVPVNYYPVVLPTGMSDSYLRQTPGVRQFASGVGAERGSVEFNGLLYKVSGTTLIRVYANGVVESLGIIPGSGRVAIASSIDRICFVADGRGFYWTDSGGLVEITDPDFARAIDVIYIDGYFLFIDESFIFNSDLNNPTSINPLSFGSAEVEGDPNVAVVKVRNEPYICGTETIEVFQNVGGSGFPFARVNGAMITKGVVGTFAACELEDALFFVGNGRGEAPSIYIASGGQANKVATDEMEKIIQALTSAQLAEIYCETYTANGQYFVLVHLTEQTLVYDLNGSRAAGSALWHVRKSDHIGYRLRGFIRIFDKWIVGDSMDGRIGEVRDDLPTEYDDSVFREFTTPLGFVEGREFVVHSATLYGLPGRTALQTNPRVSMSISRDGITYGQERWVESGKHGQFGFKPAWRQLGRANYQMSLKFRVANESFFTPARLEIEVEPMNA